MPGAVGESLVPHHGVPEVRQDRNAVHDAAQVASEGSQVQGVVAILQAAS